MLGFGASYIRDLTVLADKITASGTMAIFVIPQGQTGEVSPLSYKQRYGDDWIKSNYKWLSGQWTCIYWHFLFHISLPITSSVAARHESTGKNTKPHNNTQILGTYCTYTTVFHQYCFRECWKHARWVHLYRIKLVKAGTSLPHYFYA